MIRIYSTVFILAGFILSTAAISADDVEPPKIENGTLSINITGLRNDRGLVRVALFNSKESFPKGGKEFRKLNVKPDEKEAVVEIRDLPLGEYAVAMYHDENLNNKFNKGFYLIFMEKYGFSNDAKPSMKGPPDFEMARIFLRGEQKTITIKAQ